MSSSKDIKREVFDDSEISAKVCDLGSIISGRVPIDEFSNDELLRLGIGYGIPGPLSDEQVRREAAEILSELEEAR